MIVVDSNVVAYALDPASNRTPIIPGGATAVVGTGRTMDGLLVQHLAGPKPGGGLKARPTPRAPTGVCAYTSPGRSPAAG